MKRDWQYKKDELAWSAGKECWKYRWIYFITCAASIFFTLFVIWSIPDEYAAQIKIADEHKETGILIGLDNFSGWLEQMRYNGGDNNGLKDPAVYSFILSSNHFAKEISSIQVPKYAVCYGDYLRKHHQEPWWNQWGKVFKKYLGCGIEREDYILEIIQKNIKYEFSPKYKTITLQVSDEDPQIAAIIVDSVRIHLQKKIIEYRRQKTAQEKKDGKIIFLAAKREYENKQRKYTNYLEIHQDAILQGEKTEIESMMKDRDDAFSRYERAAIQFARISALSRQEQPSFTILVNATVPRRRSVPQASAYFLAYTFIACVFTTWGILLRKQYIERRKEKM